MQTTTHSAREDEATVIVTAVTSLNSGETVKLRAVSRDVEDERLAFMHYGHGERVTLINFRRPEVTWPERPTTLRGRIKWHLMPWTRAPLTLEQRWALKQLD